MKFELTSKQEEKFRAWAETQPKQSYLGAGDIGYWPYEFRFTPTNCGASVVVFNVITKEELDLNDYESF